MKKVLLFVFLLLLFPMCVSATDVYSINIDVNIKQDGNAEITEIWDVRGTDGTEWYKPLYNLQNSEITNFKVYMDDKLLTYKNWNVSETLSEKAGYYGINKVDDGVELCFGKSDYNRHTFKLVYDFSNFIFNVEDAQVFYNTLIPPVYDVNFDAYTITIRSYYSFPDTLDVWGFGTKGYTYVADGVISSTNEGKIDTNQPVVILAKFPLNTFETSNTINDYKKFDDILETANANTFDYDYDSTSEPSWKDRIIMFLTTIVNFIVPLGIIGLAIGAAVKNGYGYKDNKTIDKKNTPMFRDIPCNKDIYYANALINLNNFGYKETNIFGAIILKWLRQGKIGFRNETTGIFNRETSVIDLTMNPTFESDIEAELFDIMYKASKDGLLESKELERWARSHYEKFLGIFKRIINYKIDELKASNHIYKRITKDECKKKNVMDDMIYKDSQELFGLKLFLKEFSDMKSKEAIEVKLWDEYLMFAYLFGMADKVAKQFKDLYPEIVEEMKANNFDYNTVMYINTISSKSVSAASAARSAAENYSGGGGGFNVGGGGGGSIGGGGGGISR